MSLRKRYRYLFAASSGILLFCSFPSVNFFPLAWIALVPLLVALDGVENWKFTFRIGYVAGFLFCAGLLIAIALLYPYANIFVTILGYLLLVGYTALYFAVFSVLVYHFPWKSGILFPFGVATIWVSLEWLRGWLLTGFPWGNVGYSQWNYHAGIQIASIAGVYGVSFVIVCFNAGVALLIRQRHLWRKELVATIIPFILAVFTLVYGYVVTGRSANNETESIEVALVPGNISQLDKWNPTKYPEIFMKYLNLTEKAAKEQPDVIVLPETTIRGQVLSGEWANYSKHFKQMLDRIGDIPLLVGATDNEKSGDIYNRAISVSSNGEIQGKYAKMHLVPFGEYVPLADFLPNFIQFYPFEHGKTHNLLPLKNVSEEQGEELLTQVGTSICFESSFPNHFRQFVKRGAAAMGILTNDAWFAGTALPELHLAMAPMRAVENRISVFRCANGGFTCAIDEYGRVYTRFVTPKTSDEFLIAEIALSDGKTTLYTRYGDWLPILCALISLSLILYLVVMRLQKTKST
ncbi:apolipoprotein N-acyltransferase [Candidatus Poribacteria bacterium]|nr:apolipoprotein N-acyltransferase [Candidatus Poribacteria bacterium]